MKPSWVLWSVYLLRDRVSSGNLHLPAEAALSPSAKPACWLLSCQHSWRSRWIYKLQAAICWHMAGQFPHCWFSCPTPVMPGSDYMNLAWFWDDFISHMTLLSVWQLLHLPPRWHLNLWNRRAVIGRGHTCSLATHLTKTRQNFLWHYDR